MKILIFDLVYGSTKYYLWSIVLVYKYPIAQIDLDRER